MWKRLLIALPLAFVGALWFFLLALPWGLTLRWHTPRTTALMRQRVAEAHARGDTLHIRHDRVPLDDISRSLRRAVVVAEDGRFREHHGVDWTALRQEFHYRGDDDFSLFDPADLHALLASFDYYRAHSDRIRGRSTITQQLAKNLYFSTERSALRKLEELVVAKRLELFLSKDRILELYLNSAEWGPGIFGAEAAARHYFGHSAADLSPGEAASLAATLPHPLSINPDRRPGRMAWRRRLILARMGASGPVETVPIGEEEAADTVPELLGTPVDSGSAVLDTGLVRVPADTVPPDTGLVRVPADTVPPDGGLAPPPPEPRSGSTAAARGEDQPARPVPVSPPTAVVPVSPPTAVVPVSPPTALSIARATQRVVRAPNASSASGVALSVRSAVETAKTTSPSNGVCAGAMRRAIAADPARARI